MNNVSPLVMADDHQAFASPDYSRRDRIYYSISLFSLGSILVVSRLLHPSPRGVGTHEQLGLPPCLFLKLTGIPCPSCGLTTSFAHAVRFHLYESFITQPFGLLACAVIFLLIPTIVILMWRRVPWDGPFQAFANKKMFYTALVIYLAAWAYKIVVMS